MLRVRSKPMIAYASKDTKLEIIWIDLKEGHKWLDIGKDWRRHHVDEIHGRKK